MPYNLRRQPSMVRRSRNRTDRVAYGSERLMTSPICNIASVISDRRAEPSEGEVDRRSVVLGAFGPDTTTVARDDAVHGCEAHARPLELRSRMQALERLEQLVHVSHIEAHPVIADIVGRSRSLV